jgi:glutathione S-transferase
MITLHQFESSPFCDKIRRVLHVKRQPYEVREVPIHRALQLVPRVNPIGKLPCLEHDGRRVVDSTDIALYLEETFPDPPLYPADPTERARCHVLEDWADESLFFYEATLRFAFPNNARRVVPRILANEPGWFQRIGPTIMPAVLRRGLRGQGVGRKPHDMVLRDVQRHVDAIGGLLGEGAWLVGEKLSIADIAVFAQMSCIRDADEGSEIVTAAPRVAAWMDRVDQATAPRV